MKKLLITLSLTIISIITFSIPNLKAIDNPSNSWYAYQVVGELWEMRYDGQLTEEWQDLYIAIPFSDNSTFSQYYSGYNSISQIVLTDTDTSTTTYISFNQLSMLGKFNSFTYGDEFVLDSNILLSLNKPVLDYDTIQFRIAQESMYDSGNGVPSQYIDHFNSLSQFSYTIPSSMKVQFEGSIIAETSETVTVEYNFLDLSVNGMTDDILKEFITYSYNSNYVKGPEDWHIFNPLISENYRGNTNTLNSSLSINMIYDDLTSKFKIPSNFQMTFNLDYFNFYESTLDMLDLVPMNVKINSQIGSSQIDYTRLIHSELQFSESFSLDPEIQNQDLYGVPKFQYYSINFPYTDNKSISVSMPDFNLHESPYPTLYNLGVYTNKWDYATSQYISLFSSQDNTIEITYLKTSSGSVVDDFIIEHEFDYSELETQSLITSISKIELVDPINNTVEFSYIQNQYTHKFKMNLPEDILFQNLSLGNMVIYNDDPYYMYLNIEYDGKTSYQLDLKSSMYNQINKFKTIGFTAKESNDVAVMYMFLPKTYDYLYSANLSYDYRIKGLMGYDSWQNVTKRYNAFNENNDGWFDYDYTEINPSRLYFLAGLYGLMAYGITDSLDVYDQQTIQKKTIHELPQDISEKYIEYFADTPEELNNYYYYRIVLGQYRTLTSIGFDISNMVIIDLEFLESGEIITINEELIDGKIEDYIEENKSLPEYVTYVYNLGLNALDGVSNVIKVALTILSTGLIIFVVYKFTSLITKKNKK